MVDKNYGCKKTFSLSEMIEDLEIKFKNYNGTKPINIVSESNWNRIKNNVKHLNDY